jgi:hypothetical protein
MLSDRERRVLQEVEQGIAADDPRLAARMRSWPGARRERGFGGVVIAVLAVAAVLCVALQAVVPGLVAGIAAILLAARRHGRRRPDGRVARWWRWCTSDDGPTDGVG